ncbi:hypothetical protein J6590_064032 [Homalodisca vitripennis]|nr:hypothetical protein J6590_064032 [Homalodisca vitripennis]
MGSSSVARCSLSLVSHSSTNSKKIIVCALTDASSDPVTCTYLDPMLPPGKSHDGEPMRHQVPGHGGPDPRARARHQCHPPDPAIHAPLPQFPLPGTRPHASTRPHLASPPHLLHLITTKPILIQSRRALLPRTHARARNNPLRAI